MSRSDRPSLAQLKAAALATLPQLVEQWLPGGELRGHHYVALNPRRDDHHLGSFRIDLCSGRWRDHAIGMGGGDPLSLLAYLRCRSDHRLAVSLLADEPLVRAALACGQAGTAPAKHANDANVTVSPERLKQLLAKSSPPVGTPAEAYLASRGLHQNDAWDVLRVARLRHPSGRRHWSLLAPFTSPDGALVGVQRTYVQPNGSKLAIEPVRMTLGAIQGCAIHLGEPEDRLIICEGLEDGLTLYQELDSHPVWVAGGAVQMAAMAIPDSVRHLIIAADNDAAGTEAAQLAAERLSICRRAVSIMRPSPRFKDFNDQLRGIDHGA